MDLQTIIYYIGILSSLYLLGYLVQHIYLFLRPSSLPRYLHGSKDGRHRESWALITGATDGIGLGFAQELCSRGFNVILHGRNSQKLQNVQEQLKREYPASKTLTVVFDAGESSSLDSMIHEFGGHTDEHDDDEVNLTVLINNVGGTRIFPPDSPAYPALQNYTPSQVDQIMNLNARFTAQLTRLLLPTLIRNGPSLIMNISSSAAMGMPYISIYGATKAFVDSFTKGIKAEMVGRGHDVDVLGIRVSRVKSGGNDVPAGFWTPTSRRMARAALGKVGCGKMVVWGYWPHQVQTFVFEFLHEKVFQKVVIWAMDKEEKKALEDRKRE